MTPPFLTQPVDGGSFGITSLPLPMASLISAIVSFSTLLLPLTLLLTSLGLMSFPFLILPFAFSDHFPFQTLLPTLLVVLLPSARCFHLHVGHPLLLYASHVAFYRQSFPLRLRVIPAGLALPAILLLHPDEFH